MGDNVGICQLPYIVVLFRHQKMSLIPACRRVRLSPPGADNRTTSLIAPAPMRQIIRP
ncbi:hypothetical protein KCP71_08155 [Salmonella enterica subsp. enterica]|nr:hypothetical protein KCP71_08155 [Salmonella enterica subsp. enterica]